MGIQLHPSTTSENLIIYQAIKENKLEDIISLLDDGADVNTPIWTTGPFAGYTALHVACMENKDDLVELLTSKFEANVNAIAEDGVQPIHLACFYEPCTHGYDTSDKKIYSLLTAKANPDAEFGREIFTKHVKNESWCFEFGDKMALVTYAVIYKKPCIAMLLGRFKANLKIISQKNKTLLMYAIENNFVDAAMIIDDCKLY